MSTADHILDQIDSALHDYGVSDDAMRSRPEPEPRGIAGYTPTVAIMDEAGEWQDMPGVASVEIHVTTSGELENLAQRWAEFQARRIEQARREQEAFTAFARAYAQAVMPAMEAVAQGFAELQKAVQHIDPPLPPGRRHDRPAWQSPYGPPRRRR